MDVFFTGAVLFVVCLALAMVEVQIEGRHGWAASLPTWRIDRPWIRKLTNGKPITGYHVYLNLAILGFVHLPVVWSQWTLTTELQTLSLFFIIAVWWDFLWFVINPAFGLRRFKSANIWWHDKWFLGIPQDYYAGTAVSLTFWLLGDFASPDAGVTVFNWATLFAVVVCGAVVTWLIVRLMQRREATTQDEEPSQG